MIYFNLERLWDIILDIIYPPRCPVCGTIRSFKIKKVCTECISKLIYITEPRCKKCSKPIEYEDKEYCSDCEKHHLSYEYGFALWAYNAHIKKSISEFKNNNKKEYAKFYIEELIQKYGEKILKMRVDVIVPIPLHRSRKYERGYNQAEILAKGIGRELGIPVISDLLIRNKKTIQQKYLTDKERYNNMQEAFIINKSKIRKLKKPPIKVLLVDDIYTTGNTIEACTRVLLQSNIKQVYFVTLGIGIGY